jgi:hypothetical protein
MICSELVVVCVSVLPLVGFERSRRLRQAAVELAVQVSSARVQYVTSSADAAHRSTGTR